MKKLTHNDCLNCMHSYVVSALGKDWECTNPDSDHYMEVVPDYPCEYYERMEGETYDLSRNGL